MKRKAWVKRLILKAVFSFFLSVVSYIAILTIAMRFGESDPLARSLQLILAIFLSSFILSMAFKKLRRLFTRRTKKLILASLLISFVPLDRLVGVPLATLLGVFLLLMYISPGIFVSIKCLSLDALPSVLIISLGLASFCLLRLRLLTLQENGIISCNRISILGFGRGKLESLSSASKRAMNRMKGRRVLFPGTSEGLLPGEEELLPRLLAVGKRGFKLRFAGVEDKADYYDCTLREEDGKFYLSVLCSRELCVNRCYAQVFISLYCKNVSIDILHDATCSV